MSKNFLKLYPDYSSRVYGLDIMRALAIIPVVMGHGGFILEKAETNFPWVPLIDGVELFFVLSGFLIGTILLKLFNEPDFKFKSLINFFKRRWLRTLPNYYFILVINIIIVYLGIIKEDFSQFNFKFFFFLQNFSSYFTGFFWESWSLSIEEWFYILFPFLLLLLFCVFRNSVERKNIFLLAIAAFLIIPFVLRINKSLNTDVDEFWLGVKILRVVIYRLDSIAFGILAAYIKFYAPGSFYQYKWVLFISGLLLLYSRFFYHTDINTLYKKAFDISLITMGCTMMLPLFDSIKSGRTFLVKIVTHISLISYSMYLINLCIVAEIIRDHFLPETKVQAWITCFMYWALVIVLSTLLYKYYEKPIMDLRKNLKSKVDFKATPEAATS